MDQIIQLLESWGLIGLIVASFAESIFSPILPDFLLIPMALANPKNAIFYGLVATVTSVVGGILGYWLGIKYGLPLVKKMVPQKYLKIIDDFTQHNAGWAVFLAAMSPIPYKFVSITSGALRIPLGIFLFASFCGRAKRFLLEGILIYYFGEAAKGMIKSMMDNLLIGSGILVVLIVLGYWFYHQKKSKEKLCAKEIEQAE